MSRDSHPKSVGNEVQQKVNLALWNEQRKEYYLACVRKGAETQGGGERYYTRGKRVGRTGKIVELCQTFGFGTRQEAEDRCRDMAKTKVRKRRYVPVPLEKLPVEVQAHLEVPADEQVTPQEMVALLVEARRERYVVFSDVTGMEDWFDAGVSYVGYETDEKDTLKVYDRYGKLRECFWSRVKSIEPTERAVEVYEKSGGSNVVVYTS